MNRRHLLAATSLSTSLSLTTAIPFGKPRAAAAVQKAPSFKLGCQSGPTTAERLQFFKRHSVNHCCGILPAPKDRLHYSVDELSALRELCEKNGVALEMIAPPFLASSHVDRTAHAAVMLGQSPERDRDIEQLQLLIRNSAKVGIPAIKYNMSLLGVLRTKRTPGRGGSSRCQVL